MSTHPALYVTPLGLRRSLPSSDFKPVPFIPSSTLAVLGAVELGSIGPILVELVPAFSASKVNYSRARFSSGNSCFVVQK